MEEKFIEITLSPAKLINLYLQGRGIKYKWVADNLDCSNSYVYMVCNECVPMPESMRQKINELLETDY